MLIAAVALSLAATPTVADVGRQLAGRLRRRTVLPVDLELIPREMPGPVFIAGMGRRGRAVADALTEFGIGYAAVERDERRLREAVADGYRVMFGDVGDIRIWNAVAMEHRKISDLTAPSLETSTQVNTIARTLYPDLRRFAAVEDTVTGSGFTALGLTAAVDGGPAPGIALAAAVLGALGIEGSRINAWAAVRRSRAKTPVVPALAVP